MLRKFFHYWRTLGEFDKVGAWLVAWEFLSLGAGVVVLPLAQHGRVSVSVLLFLAANSIGLATALSAWVLTHLLCGRQQEVPGETVQEFVETRVKTFRERHARPSTRR